MFVEAQQIHLRAAWNTGRIIGPKPLLKPRHIWTIRTRLLHDRHVRDLALFNLVIDSKLHGSDLVRLRVVMSCSVEPSGCENRSSSRRPAVRCPSN